MLKEEHIKPIKEQLINQIKETFPEDKKQSAISQIEVMSIKELEEFLIKNNMLKPSSPGEGTSVSPEERCIFCSIVSGGVNSYKIDENAQAIAILEINPISKGHSIILPKEHNSNPKEISKQAFKLAEKVSKKIKSRLKPNEVKISASCIVGHCIINILPIYKSETLNSEKHQASQEELLEFQKLLQSNAKIPKSKKSKTKNLSGSKSKKFWLPRRIP